MTKLLIITAFLLFGSRGMSQANNDEFQKVWRSPYYLGRGDTGIALADDHHAPIYNPAGLAIGKGIFKKFVLLSPSLEVSSATRDLIRQIEVEKSPSVDALRNATGNPQHANASNASALIFRRAAIGFYTHANTNILVSLSRHAGGLHHVEAGYKQDQTFTFSLAESFWDNTLATGATVKYITREQGAFTASVIDSQELKNLRTEEISDSGTALGLDLGLILKLKGKVPLSFGLTVENFGRSAFATAADGIVSDLEQTINLGIAAEPASNLSKMRLLADFRDLTGEISEQPLRHINIGAEITIRDYFGVTAGVHQGYFTGGGYFDIRFLRLDIGGYTQERGSHLGLRPDTRFYFSLALAI